MAEPTYVFSVNTSDTTTVAKQPLTASDTLRFAGASGVTDPITAPAVGYYKVADKLWLDTSSTDYEVTRAEGGGTTATYTSAMGWTLNKDDYIIIQATVDGESAVGDLTCWDDGNYNTTAREILNGTALMAHSFIRAVCTHDNVTTATLSTDDSSTIPSTYDTTQADTTTTHQLQGSTYSITQSAALTLNYEHRYVIHAYIPADAVNGEGTAHQCKLVYTYYYT